MKRIYIEEHPSSLLLARNEIGNFSCRAYCNQSTPCFGQWIIDGKTILNESDASHTGFTFSKETTKENEHSLRLSVNASESNNNSMIQCEYQSFQFGYRSNFSNRIVTRSRTARVIVLPSECLHKWQLQYKLTLTSRSTCS